MLGLLFNLFQSPPQTPTQLDHQKERTQFPILRLQDGEIDVLIGFNGKDEQKKSVHLNMWGVVGLVKSREDMCHSQVHSVFVGMEERRGD